MRREREAINDINEENELQTRTKEYFSVNIPNESFISWVAKVFAFRVLVEALKKTS